LAKTQLLHLQNHALLHLLSKDVSLPFGTSPRLPVLEVKAIPVRRQTAGKAAANEEIKDGNKRQ